VAVGSICRNILQDRENDFSGILRSVAILAEL